MPPFQQPHDLYEALCEGRWQPHIQLTTVPEGMKASFVSSLGKTVESIAPNQFQALNDMQQKLRDLALTGEIEP